MRRYKVIILVLLLGMSGFQISSISAAIPAPEPQNQTQFFELIEKKSKATENRLQKQLEIYFDAQILKAIDEKSYQSEDRLQKKVDQQFSAVEKLFNSTRDSFEWLIERATWVFLLLVAIAVFLFWKQDRTLKDLIETRFKKTEQRIQTEIKILEDQVAKWKEKLKEELLKFENLKRAYDTALSENEELKNQLESITAYKHKKNCVGL